MAVLELARKEEKEHSSYSVNTPHHNTPYSLSTLLLDGPSSDPTDDPMIITTVPLDDLLWALANASQCLLVS